MLVRHQIAHYAEGDHSSHTSPGRLVLLYDGYAWVVHHHAKIVPTKRVPRLHGRETVGLIVFPVLGTKKHSDIRLALPHSDGDGMEK